MTSQSPVKRVIDTPVGAGTSPQKRATLHLHGSPGLATSLLLILLAGCQNNVPKLGSWDGPQNLASPQVEAWMFKDRAGRRIKTAHYVIHTTIESEEALENLPKVMEGALGQYQRVAPVPLNCEPPMKCYVFARRLEWEAFTRANTSGRDAAVYLQIRRGGYTVGDQFVAYYLGRESTAAVAAHEGWHQYVARHFVGRLPPFLEEGMSCLFEGVAWKDDMPRWNLCINQVRVQALRRSIENNRLWPLERLLAMHAGEAVEHKGERVEAFYAQAWAFARFLYESENGRFRPALQKWLMDTASGQVFDPTHSHQRSGESWNRYAVKPMLEHYLNLDFAQIDKLYQAYIQKVAFDEYASQWSS